MTEEAAVGVVSDPDVPVMTSAKPRPESIFHVEMRHLRRLVAEKQQVVDDLSLDLKSAKADLEKAMDAVLKRIDDEDAEPSLPFDRPADAPGAAQEAAGDAIPPTDDSWMAVPLSEALAGLPPGLLGKLEDAELKTMGDLAAWNKLHVLTDIPGVGKEKAKKIEDALEEFWKARAPKTDVQQEMLAAEDGPATIAPWPPTEETASQA